MTRRIRSHKGGRTARAPEARMTPSEKARLDAVLQHYSAKYVNWLIDHVEQDYAEIQGDDTMASKLSRIQIRDASNSDTFRAVKIFSDGSEAEVKRDYGTIGEAARDNFDAGVRIYRGKREITRDYAESGEIG